MFIVVMVGCSMFIVVMLGYGCSMFIVVMVGLLVLRLLNLECCCEFVPALTHALAFLCVAVAPLPVTT